MTKRPSQLTDRRVAAIATRLAEGKRVRRLLPIWGRLHVDRQLPFVCVYRQPVDRPDPGTHQLINSQAAYVKARGARAFHPHLTGLLERIAEVMIQRFGAFLIVEIWAGPIPDPDPTGTPPRPRFRIHRIAYPHLPETWNTLEERLLRVRISKQTAEVDVATRRRVAPPDMRSLFSRSRLADLGCGLVGVEVSPIHINPETGEVFPLLVRSLARQLGHVLDRTFYRFTIRRTTHQPPHYHALGRRAVVRAVWDIDRSLAAIDDSYDFLLQVTPANVEAAWRRFQRSKFSKPPSFLYRPRPVDPSLVKRNLYKIPIERVEDPTLQELFRGKQMEIDRQLTMLHDLGTAAFVHGSLQLHGPISHDLRTSAQDILEQTPTRSREGARADMLDAEGFVQRVRSEIEWYRAQYPSFDVDVEISDELYQGLLVSRGKLLVGRGTRIPARRAHALLQHEVGTHLVTYVNGRAQPLSMLYSGLPGYDELQEGLAVLGEYLVGGLSVPRLRVLAARVLAADAMVRGAAFIDVFRLLDDQYGFSQRTSWIITMRVFRAGGLVKDAVYLRGLIRVLQYVADGGAFDTLFVGKIAARHVGVIRELLLRKVLKPPPVMPRYHQDEQAMARLDELRTGTSVLQLVRESTRRTR
ncbi:MAG: flavohemoglobin expression-modulating QEGLA motif protein [Deltaproteobacteria bacterium]|nr:flavohemoglobin expression-modulating QEGLA motif protein [Deltaproteobacteria bacterium]MBW2531565.1 flavohemoglobin expression-modulating QEGLA motif protein [Deltaproteobacteria bacterium]